MTRTSLFTRAAPGHRSRTALTCAGLVVALALPCVGCSRATHAPALGPATPAPVAAAVASAAIAEPAAQVAAPRFFGDEYFGPERALQGWPAEPTVAAY